MIYKNPCVVITRHKNFCAINATDDIDGFLEELRSNSKKKIRVIVHFPCTNLDLAKEVAGVLEQKWEKYRKSDRFFDAPSVIKQLQKIKAIPSDLQQSDIPSYFLHRLNCPGYQQKPC